MYLKLLRVIQSLTNIAATLNLEEHANMLKHADICHSFIHGKYISTAGEQEIRPNYFPATNQIINHIAYSNESEIAQAVQSAKKAFSLWSRLTVHQRSAILIKAAMLLRSRVTELARLEVLDTGKPISEALSVDVISAAESLEYFAKVAIGLHDSVMPYPQALIYTQREPLGVCVGIGAWNYPLQIACWKAAPALIMGNTMIFKPSELTPQTALKLAEIFIEAGMPAGVFNVVLGDGNTAQQLLAQEGISKISFTGSIPTGKKILRQAAEHIIPVTLELGGKSPLIIFDDADLSQAVIGSIFANFYTQGEICSNGTRVFVSRSIYERYLEMLQDRVGKLKIGDPLDLQTQIGALISPAHLQKVMSFIESGKNEGAELICGGKKPDNNRLASGNFLMPTIFTRCSDSMTIVKEEIFGPIMSVLQFDDEEEVLYRANQTHYGLAAGLFTNDIKRGHRIAKQLQAGVCWINNYNVTPVSMPFGGTKQSGFGRENGMSALLNYSQQKSIYVELGEIEHSYQ